MKTWLRRIRGAIGMGLTWAVAWSGAGFLLARIPGFSSALLFAPLGFISGVMFSGIIATLEGGRGSARLSLPRSAGWGAAGGVLLTGIIAIGAALGGRSVSGEILLFGPPLAVAGALSADGSLALARRADTQGLPGVSEEPAEVEPLQRERRALA